MAHPFSSSTSSSPNSSGFVSGSESMYQGLNEPSTLSIRGNRLTAPSLSRLYLLRRQSASPYSPQEGELKEEDDSASSSGNPAKLDISGSCTSLLIPPQNEVLHSSFESSEGMVSDTNMRQSEERSPVPCLTVSSPPHPQINVPITPPPPQISCEEFADQPSSVSKESQRSGGTRSRAASLRDEQFEDPGMAQIPVWLKSLRLHKYIGLFKRLTYYQMLGITDEWLQHQHVTQGARNKIIVSIANLGTRSATLTNLESLIEACIQNSSLRASNFRGCLCELRSILQTPFPPSPSQPSATSPQRCISPTSSLEDTNFMFGSDVEDFVGVDDDGDFEDFQPPSRSLCQCPCTNSDTCLFDRSGVGLHSPKRPKSSEGGAVAAASAVNTTEIETMRQFFPSDNPHEQPENTGEQEQQGVPSSKEAVEEENLAEQIMRCLRHGYKALLSEPIENNDNYGFFMQLLAIVLDHPSFSRSQKDQVIFWEKEMVERLGPAPPPPRRSSFHHHHRAVSRRSSYQYSSSSPYQGPPIDRGGSHSAPYTPRPSVGPPVLSRPYFTSPVRMSYLHPQSQQPTPHSPFLQAPSPFGTGGPGQRWSGGIVRGRSAEPDVYHLHHQGGGMPLRATAYHEQQQATAPPPPPPMVIVPATHCGQHQQRVASMDSLTVVSTPYGLMEPYPRSSVQLDSTGLEDTGESQMSNRIVKPG
ncbi:hypothetical protein ACTXT7_011015 [Hymenolepis weldensis]